MTLRTKLMGLATYVVAMGIVVTPARAVAVPPCGAGFYADWDTNGQCYQWAAFACAIVQPSCGYANVEYSYCGYDGSVYCDWSPN